MKPIGKLLWHKAVRETASYSAAPDNDGLVVITIPVIFLTHPMRIDKSSLFERLHSAICKHLHSSATYPAPMDFLYSSKILLEKVNGHLLIYKLTYTITTNKLEHWQWITNHRFKGGEQPKGIYFNFKFNP